MKNLGCLTMIIFGVFMIAWLWQLIELILWGITDFTPSFIPLITILTSFIAWGVAMLKTREHNDVGRPCKECGGNMTTDQLQLMSNPPKYCYKCSKCGNFEVDN